METVVESLGTAFSSVSSSAMSAIGTAVPYALPIVGAVIVVSVTVKAFKSIASK